MLVLKVHYLATLYHILSIFKNLSDYNAPASETPSKSRSVQYRRSIKQYEIIEEVIYPCFTKSKVSADFSRQSFCLFSGKRLIIDESLRLSERKMKYKLKMYTPKTKITVLILYIQWYCVNMAKIKCWYSLKDTDNHSTIKPPFLVYNSITYN